MMDGTKISMDNGNKHPSLVVSIARTKKGLRPQAELCSFRRVMIFKLQMFKFQIHCTTKKMGVPPCRFLAVIEERCWIIIAL